MNNDDLSQISGQLDEIIDRDKRNRRLQIRSMNREFEEAQLRRNRAAIAAGLCVVGVAASTLASGIDIDAAVQLEIQALSSIDALKEYLAMLTPAMYMCVAGAVISIRNCIRHGRNARRIFDDLSDLEADVDAEDRSNGRGL